MSATTLSYIMINITMLSVFMTSVTMSVVATTSRPIVCEENTLNNIL